MCDEAGAHQGFKNLQTAQGFVPPKGWTPDLSHKPPVWPDDIAKPPSPPLPVVRPCSVAGMAWCDPALPIPQRAAALVSKLDIAEKVAQLSTYSFAKKYRHRYTPPVPRIGLPGYSYHTEGLHGLRDSYIAGLNATLFPQVTAMAATANATLVHEMARIMGVEARAVHNVYMEYLDSGGRGGNCTPSLGRCSGNNTDIGTRGGYLRCPPPPANPVSCVSLG